MISSKLGLLLSERKLQIMKIRNNLERYTQCSYSQSRHGHKAFHFSSVSSIHHVVCEGFYGKSIQQQSKPIFIVHCKKYKENSKNSLTKASFYSSVEDFF